MVNLIVFGGEIEKYNVLIVIIVELVEGGLQHAVLHNLKKYEVVYDVHDNMHVKRLKLIMFEEL